MSGKLSIDFSAKLLSHVVVDGVRQPLKMKGEAGEREYTQAEALANMLANQSNPEYPPVKLILWCYALGEKRPLEVGDDDLELLKKVIEKSGASINITGQFLMTIIKAQKDADAAEVENQEKKIEQK